MAAPMNSGESDMVAEDFLSNLSPLLSPRWSQLCLTPSPPRPFLPSSSSMVMQYQGCNQSTDNPPQNQGHEDIVDPAPYLAGDSALLQQQLRKNNQGFEELNMGFEEESEEETMTCFYFPPSPTYFPMYRPMPTVFFVSTSNIQDISLALSYQHLLEDKSGALHVLNGVERRHIVDLLLGGYKSYVENKFGDLYQTARAAGVVPEVVESLVHIVVEGTDEREVTLRRINWLEQHDEYIVDQPVFETVGVAQQLIQNSGGELDVIFGGGVSMINGLEFRDSQGSPTTPETLLICPFKYSVRVWLGHGGQWAAEGRYRCNRLNIGSFTTVEDAISAYELVVRQSGWMDPTGFPGLFESGYRSKLPPQLPPITQEEKRGENFGLVRCNAMGNDEIEAVGTGSEGTGECVMADQARLNSVCLEKSKTKEKNPGGERGNQKTNGVRIAIPLENILQTKGMRRKDAAKHLKVSITKLKSSCREYGIQRWPPRNEHKLIRQSLPNATPSVVDQEGIPHSIMHILEDKSGALHVIYGEEFLDIVELLVFNGIESYVAKFDDLEKIASAAGVLPKGVESLVDNIFDEHVYEYIVYEMEGTLRRINWLEQQDEAIVGEPVFEQVGVVQQLIQNRGGELDVIFGGGVLTLNGLEWRDSQGPPTNPETLLICQAKVSLRVWLEHDGQWAIELRSRSNRLNIGSFTTVEDVISAYEVVARWSGWMDLTGFPELFENENRTKLPLQLPLIAQELNPVEVVGTGSDGIGDSIPLDSGCLGKRKTKEKNSRGERRSKKTNEVRIAIPLDDILQIKGMSLKEAANHLGVSQSSLKYACRKYGIARWPPRKFFTQSHPNETPALGVQEGIPQLNSDTLPSDQALVATVEKITSVVVKEILPLPFLPTTSQENLNEDFGNFEAEAVGIGSGGTWQSEMKEGQLNSKYLGKEKKNEMTPRGERRNKETGGVRIAISLEEILQTKEMPLKDAAKHLNVSKSTLKRACREYDIPRWPPRGEHKPISQSCPNESPAVVDKEQIPQLKSDMLLPSNHVSTTTGTESVTMKARFGKHTIKFQLSWPFGTEELKQQVKKRLELEAGTYYINYKDEDNDDILIGCDEDLQDHISRSSIPGTNSIEVFLQLK